MTVPVSILAAAVQLPDHNCAVADLFQEEGITYTPDVEARLGIQRVPIRNGESGSNMAVEAARRALKLANVDPAQVDVIVEYSILPQEYLVPVWNMSNKVQGEIGAGKSFVVGFSGGGATNYLVALSSAAALLQENENLKTALLVTADVTIPGNRVLNPSSPVTVMGDAASAVVMQKGAASTTVLGTELWSEGANHDICYIPGGSLVHPDNADLYRLELDHTRYRAFAKVDALKRMTQPLLERAGLKLDDVASIIYPNVSSEDQAVCQEALDNKMSEVCATNLATHGHLQGTDFVVNYLSLMESGAMQKGNYILIASHGMGALAGASLLQC
jgi:3-oxoacyl-[acyl-carrier-protein] synthase-3